MSVYRGYLKEKVYVNRPSILEDLKASMCREIRIIALDLPRKVMNLLTTRVRMCIDWSGYHLKGIILKKLQGHHFHLELTRHFYLC